jgi:ADP-ribosylglycohydrolase
MRIRVIPDQPSIAKEEEERKDRLNGALYGQAIFDALGLTTEFLSRKQAKTFLHNSKCIEYSQAGKIKIRQEHIDNFLRDPYGIRKIKVDGNDPYGCIKDISNPSQVYGDQQTSRWRQLGPKGSPTDDTDQAVLKFFALRNVQGDLESAKKKFAKYIVNWSNGKLEETFGRSSFGLGSNTKEVMARSSQGIDQAGHQQFLHYPVARSKAIWVKNFLEQDFFTQANGALMSSSYILQYYPDSLELAQKATQELAKVTHYNPLVSAHCVAYVTMLYKLQNHQGELSDDNYQKYLAEAFEAGEKILDERKGDYEELIAHKQSQNLVYNYDLDVKMTEWKNQMRKAIFSEIVSEKFEKWEDLELTNPRFETDPIKATKGSQPYDNIGMSHRALSAGFFALTRLREKININSKTPQNALTEICLELMAQGGDTDTNGTVVGSLCGSYLGFSKIPPAMIDGFGKGNDGEGAGNIEDKDEQGQPKGFKKVKDKELLDEIKNIANKKISKLQAANVTQGIKITPATIIKPTFSMKFASQDNFWANHVRPSDQYRRGNDYLVLKDDPNYMTQGNVDININAVQKVMANVIYECQTQLKMTDDEVKQAIILAKKYGGLGNVNEEKLSQDALIASYGQEEKKEKLNKFRQFSYRVQKLNQQKGIYSGRKDGKLVGLRLTFVSEEAILLWQQNSHFTINSRGGAAAGGVPRGGGGGAGRDITGR